MKNRKWLTLTAIIWMAAIFFVTQLPYFTGKNIAEIIEKVVVAEH
jgi:hypothetical protein